jgi:hypothetical protein
MVTDRAAHVARQIPDDTAGGHRIGLPDQDLVFE